jgi:hypothetical protein
VNPNIINTPAGFSPPPTGQVAVVVVRTLKGYRGQIVSYGTETILFESKPRKTAEKARAVARAAVTQALSDLYKWQDR